MPVFPVPSTRFSILVKNTSVHKNRSTRLPPRDSPKSSSPPDNLIRKPCDDQLAISLEKRGGPLESTASSDPQRRSYLEELDRASEIYRDSLNLARQSLDDARLGRKPDVDKAEDLIEDIVHSITRQNDALVSLCKLRAFDEYTYTHSVNACVISVAFGVHQHFALPLLKKLGIAAMFHDVGKSMLPKEVLNKPGKLTMKEFEIVQQHPAMGFCMLDQHDLFDTDVLDAVLQHHEKLNGGGYPLGLAGAHIHPLAQLVSLAEVYDALTSKRVYKPRIIPNEALKIIYSLRGKDFIPENVDCFIKWLGIYPVGSFVRLSNGYTAIVSCSNPDAPLYPSVTVILDERGRHLRSQTLDLQLLKRDASNGEEPLSIVSSLNPKELNLDPADYLI